MPNDPDRMMRLLDAELGRVSDPARRTPLAALLVFPSRINLAWDYEAEGGRLGCWLVGQSPDHDALLLYSEHGFGPSFPWGLVFPREDSMGMDSQWHSSLEDAAINAGLLQAPSGYGVPGPRGAWSPFD